MGVNNEDTLNDESMTARLPAAPLLREAIAANTRISDLHGALSSQDGNRNGALPSNSRAHGPIAAAMKSSQEDPVSFVPSDDWLNAFNAQCTEERWKKLERFAARCARGVEKAGGIVDDYYVRELVQDVLADTRLGVLRWDPSVESLEEHAQDAITSRAYHDRAHAKRYPRESIDAFDPDSSHATMAAVDASLLDRREASLHTAALAENALMELRELAAEDSVVLRFLDAFEAGATTKSDVMLVADLSDRTYHAARIRLDRLVTRLSPDAQPNRVRSLPGSRPMVVEGEGWVAAPL